MESSNNKSLKLTERYTVKTEGTVSSLEEALKKAAGKNFKAAVYLVHEFRFGYWRGDHFEFADGKNFDEKYLLEMRLFNDTEEIYLQKKGCLLLVRTTEDAAADNGGCRIKTVDSTSRMFGRKCAASLPENFVKLYESGRKISIVIPAEEQAEKYNLTTRSYVVYDKTTGQAGYGWYRWVSLQPAAGKDGE